MVNLQKLEGFILKKKTLLGKDIIVTIFTKENGKIVAIAKGARKITSRRIAHLQTANLVNVHLSQSHGIYYIQSTELISGFIKIRTTAKLSVVYLYFYILDKLLPQEQNEELMYRLTKRLFIDLSSGELKEKVILKKLLQQTLVNLGYIHEQKSMPELISEVEKNIEEKLPSHVIMEDSL